MLGHAGFNTTTYVDDNSTSLCKILLGCYYNCTMVGHVGFNTIYKCGWQ